MTAPTLVKANHLSDGAVLTMWSDGSWIIDVPLLGRYEVRAPDHAAADTLARVQGER